MRSQVISKAWKPWNNPYRSVAVGIGATIAAVIVLPRCFTETWPAALTLIGSTGLLLWYRWSRMVKSAERKRHRVTDKHRAQAIAKAFVPMNIAARRLAIVGIAMQLGSALWVNDALRAKDEHGYIEAQTIHAYLTDRDGMFRAIALSRGAFRGELQGPDCSTKCTPQRRALIATARTTDVFRASMLRVDAECRERLHFEVAEDIRRIHRQPFDLLDPDMASITDAFFDIHDYQAGVLLARSANV